MTTTSTTTRLLTLLNVSALKTRKRKREDEEESAPPPPTKKLNAKRVVQIEAAEVEEDGGEEEGDDDDEGLMDEDKEIQETEDPYNAHFSAEPKCLSTSAKEAVDKRRWTTSKRSVGKLGEAVLSIPEGSEDVKYNGDGLLDKLRSQMSTQSDGNKGEAALQKDLLSCIGSYQDLYVTKHDVKTRSLYRDVLSLHMLNHIMKIRRRVLKNNEKLSNAPKDAEPSDSNAYLDQGFVRPSVLVLLPFRSSAFHWVTAFLQHTPEHQVENKARFRNEFSLPPGADDKLLSAPQGTYPDDHVANMAGNIDDFFRIGLKFTRKSIKLFADFYSSDIIFASPLGLRELIEKEKSADYLSSIEILIVDQLDVLTMQNWNHIQLVFKHLNAMPKQSHDTDFSRIKPWYLDGNAAYLRQSILLSAYETPDTRALYNKNLLNVAGKLRLEAAWPAVQVPAGVRQNFVKFECGSPQVEIDKRFEYFAKQLFPSLLKSAVQSSNTVIFIPSYFDYTRVRSWLKKQDNVTFTVLSEDSDNRAISRSRQAFFAGTKAMLLVTERFHFFRRYKIRGIRNVVFYAPPDHSQFYGEFLSYPFLDEGVLPEDVTCKVLYSKYDYMRLERIVGSAEVANLMNA